MDAARAAHRSAVADGVGLAVAGAEEATGALGEAALCVDDGELLGSGLPLGAGDVQEASMASAVPSTTWTGRVPGRNLRCTPMGLHGFTRGGSHDATRV
jgi:hypothetical protein